MSKAAMIAIVGRPSAGKSTLMNALCGEKISIVTPVPQTTRNRIRGILNDQRGQLIFLDTPGFHNSERKFNRQLRQVMADSLEDCDAVLYLVDSSRRPGPEERALAEMLGRREQPLLLVFNKTDQADPSQLEKSFLPPGGDSPYAGIHRVSALKAEGLEDLKDRLFELAPESEPLYPEDFYTDQEPEFRIAEIIREQAMLRAREELPHAIYVEIQDLEIHDAEDAPGSQLWVRATIFVENKSQVGLVVGRGGEGIKAIRTLSQKEIGRVFPYRVHLDLRVKDSAKWRSNDRLIKRLTGM